MALPHPLSTSLPTPAGRSARAALAILLVMVAVLALAVMAGLIQLTPGGIHEGALYLWRWACWHLI